MTDWGTKTERIMKKEKIAKDAMKKMATAH